MPTLHTSICFLSFSLISGQSFEYKPRYACGICHEVQVNGLSCERFSSCSIVNHSSVEKGCKQFCSEGKDAVFSKAGEVSTNGLELRVTKGFGTKAYGSVRISVVTTSADPPVAGFFSYSEQFRYKWTQFYLHSALKTLQPGKPVNLNVGTEVSVYLPAQGAGVAGVLIADPCVNSPVKPQYIGCAFGDRFQTLTRTPALINAFVPGNDTDFWYLGGDNWYDRSGGISADVMSRISLAAKMKIFASVPGNHDYWVMGSPGAGTTQDQCGNGHMQYYAQDAKAAEHVLEGSTEPPFNFSVDPNADRPDIANASGFLGNGCNLPASSNFFWYNQVGNIGMIGQSGAYDLADSLPMMKEACNWLSAQQGLDVVLLMGHWDVPGLGAETDMAMPQWYEEMKVLPGCSDFDDRGMLKFIMGHTHCNNPHPYGNRDTGFRVAGFGMGGCGNYGIPIVDTTNSRVRFWYFDTSSDTLFNEVTSCVQKSGWRQCTQLASLWLDEPISHAPVPSPTQQSVVV